MDPFTVDDESTSQPSRKAEFARFHDDNYPAVVALLHALDGDRTRAHRVTQRTFTQAWRQWDTVRALSDPAAWTRRNARQAAQPRRRRSPSTARNDTEWIAPVALPTFEALAGLGEQQRAVLVLHHIAGLDQVGIATEEQLSPEAVGNRLTEAYEQLATLLGQHEPASPAAHIWAARQLDDLNHALSYGTDRRTADQVFHRAIRQRLAVASAATAALSLVGVGGAFAVIQYQHRVPPSVIPLASGPGAMLRPHPAAPPGNQPAPETPLLPPEAPNGPATLSNSSVPPPANIGPDTRSPTGQQTASDGGLGPEYNQDSGSDHSSDRSSGRTGTLRNPRPGRPNWGEPTTAGSQPFRQPAGRPGQHGPTDGGHSAVRPDRSGNNHSRGSSNDSGEGGRSTEHAHSEGGHSGGHGGGGHGGGGHGGGGHR